MRANADVALSGTRVQTQSAFRGKLLHTITFALAVMGFAGLATSVALVDILTSGQRRRLVQATALVVSAHVLLVWAVRYQWQFAAATRNGVGPFLVFHTALMLIAVAALAGDRVARRLLQVAFVVVSVGAIGAVFTYDFVEHYRVPVIALATFGFIGMLMQALRRPPVAIPRSQTDDAGR